MSTDERVACPPCREAIDNGTAHPGGSDFFMGPGLLSDNDMQSCDCICHPDVRAQYREDMRRYSEAIAPVGPIIREEASDG